MVSVSLDSLAQVQAPSDIPAVGFIALLCSLHRPKMNCRYFYLVSRIVILAAMYHSVEAVDLTVPVFSHIDGFCFFTFIAEINIFSRRSQGILEFESWKRWVVLPGAGRGLCS